MNNSDNEADESRVGTVTKKRVHFCQDIEGALLNWTRSDWREAAKLNGVPTETIKDWFRKYLKDGLKVLPMSKDCEGFSYQTGCPGHEVPIE